MILSFYTLSVIFAVDLLWSIHCIFIKARYFISYGTGLEEEQGIKILWDVNYLKYQDFK